MTWRDRAGFCRTSGQDTTPSVATKSSLFCFYPRSLSALAWPRHSCQPTFLYYAPAFRLISVTSPLWCPPPLLWSPTCLLRRGCNISATISRLLGQPFRFLRRDPPSVARPSWHRAWGRACCQSFLAKRVVSGLFVCCICWLLPAIVGYVFLGRMPLLWHAQGSLEVTIERERGISGGINKFKINNCRLTQVYCRRNGGGQEDHRCWNPSEGNWGDHFWNCCHNHRQIVREDDREALLLQTPPPASATGVGPHCHRWIVWVDKGDAPLPAVPPNCATSRPCSHLLRRATSSSPQLLPWRGHRDYSSWGASFRQASKIPHE